MRSISNIKLYFAIAAISALMFVPFIGRMHLFDWDEINFAECAREMMVSGDYLNVQINFKPFWEKPPLFIWMQVLAMKGFGVNEFAARLPNALCGIVTLLVLFHIGSRLRDRKTGLWWAFIYAASILPQLYFHTGIIDPWFNLFIFLSVYNIVLYLTPGETARGSFLYAVQAGFFIGLAVLTKGPAAILILGLVITAYLLASYKGKPKGVSHVASRNFRFTDILLFLLVALLTGGSWFILQVMNGHSDMVLKFISYQLRLFTIPDAGHGGHWSYHFWVLLAGVFPASVFALKSFRSPQLNDPLNRHFHFFMTLLFWAVLLLFSIVKTKIVHYSSLCYFPLTYFATVTVVDLLDRKIKWHRGLNALLLLLASIISVVAIGLPVAMQYKQQIIESGMIKDAFAVANLRADVNWSGYESLTGILLLAGIITGVFLMRHRLKLALLVIFGSSLLFTWVAIMVFPYKIEKYSQGAAIEFFKEKSKEHCYVLNAGYFSYAPLYYGKKMPDDVKRPMELLCNRPDRPFYLVLKEPEYEEWKHIIPAMQLLYKKNGFVFLRRVDGPGPKGMK